MDKVGLVTVIVSKVRVFVVVTSLGVIVVVGCNVVDGFVMVAGGSTVVRVEVLVDVTSRSK